MCGAPHIVYCERQTMGHLNSVSRHWTLDMPVLQDWVCVEGLQHFVAQGPLLSLICACLQVVHLEQSTDQHQQNQRADCWFLHKRRQRHFPQFASLQQVNSCRVLGISIIQGTLRGHHTSWSWLRKLRNSYIFKQNLRGLNSYYKFLSALTEEQ